MRGAVTHRTVGGDVCYERDLCDLGHKATLATTAAYVSEKVIHWTECRGHTTDSLGTLGELGRL